MSSLESQTTRYTLVPILQAVSRLDSLTSAAQAYLKRVDATFANVAQKVAGKARLRIQDGLDNAMVAPAEEDRQAGPAEETRQVPEQRATLIAGTSTAKIPCQHVVVGQEIDPEGTDTE